MRGSSTAFTGRFVPFPLPPFVSAEADDEDDPQAMMSDRLRANPKLAYFLDGRMRTFLGPDSHLKIAPLDGNRQVSFVRRLALCPSRSPYTDFSVSILTDLPFPLPLPSLDELARSPSRQRGH
jgi:hypothetical protein